WEVNTEMTEYKVLRTSLRDAESELNRLAADGWRVISTAVVSGMSFTVGTTPMIITLERNQ
ncbi:MAG: DUF4177 domain-containing protein, partial [Clostridia bacterium]|nr:DUF4177 domain-containing protein [Clostridia bacterium]